MSGLKEFHVTFGSQWGTTEEHPVSKRIHRDGYVIVEAGDLSQARLMAIKVFQHRYSNTYDEWDDDNERFYPLGEIGRIDSNGVLTIYGESL